MTIFKNHLWLYHLRHKQSFNMTEEPLNNFGGFFSLKNLIKTPKNSQNVQIKKRRQKPVKHPQKRRLCLQILTWTKQAYKYICYAPYKEYFFN